MKLNFKQKRKIVQYDDLFTYVFMGVLVIIFFVVHFFICVIGWKLLFNKRSKDGSGKANLVWTGDESLDVLLI